MKWIYSFILALLFSNSYSQDYPKMVVQGATWMYKVQGNENSTFFAYHIKGDTLLNGTSYAILHQQGIEKDSLGYLRINSNSIPSVFMREDTILKKVFAIIEDESILGSGLIPFEDCYGPGDFDNEYLLYDFGQEVGETLNSSIGFTITNIEPSEVLGHQVRRFEIEPGQDFYEKFGDEKELFFPHHFNLNGPSSLGLVHYCVTDNYDCSIFLGASAVDELPAVNFSIQPNPSLDYTTIKVEEEEIISLSLYSSDGKLLRSIDNINSKEVSVDLMDLEVKGVVTTVGQTRNSRFVGRLIVL